MGSIAENKALVVRYHELLSTGRVEEAIEMLAPDLEWTVVADLPNGGRQSREELVGSLRRIVDTLAEPLAVEITCMTAEDDRVAVVANSIAKRRNGTSYRQNYHMLLYIRDGQIYKGSPYFDSLEFAKQVYGAKVEYPGAAAT